MKLTTENTGYRNTVAEMVRLPWDKLRAADLLQLMVLSAHIAREFAESLRISRELFPEHAGLREMARGELATDNLSFDGYEEVGDHADFLWHFIHEYRLHDVVADRVFTLGYTYRSDCALLSPQVRAMSIFSRERELPAIYRLILNNDALRADCRLDAYAYYLRRHLALDEGDGGHGHMVGGLAVDDRVDEYYRLRLQLYRQIF